MDDPPQSPIQHPLDGQTPPQSQPLPVLCERPTPPRFRIHHIMAWTAATAVLLALLRGLSDGEIFSDRVPAAPVALLAAYAIASGMSMTITVFGIIWRRRGLAYFDQPGQWLGLMQSLETLMLLGWGVLIFVGSHVNFPRIPESVVILGATSLPFVTTVLFVIGFRRVSDTLSWKAFFVLNTIRYGALSILGFVVFFMFLVSASPGPGIVWVPMAVIYFMVAPPWAHCVMTVIQLLALRGDWRREEVRLHSHWTHWAGAGAWLVALLCIIATVILSMLWSV